MARKSTPLPHADRILYSVEAPENAQIEEGELIYAASVSASNIIRDVREIITNVVGGRMRRYENLIEMALDRAFDKLREKALEQGYDGVIGVRITSSTVTQGGAEIIVYGTGFRFKR